MTYPLPMRNSAIEAESGLSGAAAYADGTYPVAINETQQRILEAYGWEPVLVPADLSKLKRDDLAAAVESAGLEAPPKAKKEDLARTLAKGKADVMLDTTQEPPGVVVNPPGTKE